MHFVCVGDGSVRIINPLHPHDESCLGGASVYLTSVQLVQSAISRKHVYGGHGRIGSTETTKDVAALLEGDISIGSNKHRIVVCA